MNMTSAAEIKTKAVSPVLMAFMIVSPFKIEYSKIFIHGRGRKRAKKAGFNF